MAEHPEKKVSLEIDSDPCRASALRQEVRRFAARAGLGDAGEIERFVLAVNEAFANIVQHAYDGSRDRKVEVEILEFEDRVEVRLRDWGRPLSESDLCPRSLDDVRPGGLGLHFIKAGVDDCSYDTSLDQGTRVCLVKHKKTEKN